jgi:hypothetical protein
MALAMVIVAAVRIEPGISSSDRKVWQYYSLFNVRKSRLSYTHISLKTLETI